MSDEFEELGGLHDLGGLDAFEEDTALQDMGEPNLSETMADTQEEETIDAFTAGMAQDDPEEMLLDEEVSSVVSPVTAPEEEDAEKAAEADALDELDSVLEAGLSAEASMHARDAANMANQSNAGMDYMEEPQSLKDYDTMGMGEGLSAVQKELGMEGSGIDLKAGLQEEEEKDGIHAALEEEEEEEPIRAGRPDMAPINAGYGQPQKAVGGGDDTGEQPDFNPNYNMNNNLASDPNQNIDDIFIASSFRGGTSTAGTGGVSASGGTMYDAGKDRTDVNVSFGLPPLIRNLLVIVAFLAVFYCIFEYGLHIKLEYYVHPYDVQKYVQQDAATVAGDLGIKFKSEKENYSSSNYEYTYDVDNCGGLKLVNYNGQRMYLEVTGMRINYSIYGIRPQLTDFKDAKNILATNGFEEIDSYDESEELGAEGEEHVFVSNNLGSAVIVGKKKQYNSVKAIKYIDNYKQYYKIWSNLRGEE